MLIIAISTLFSRLSNIKREQFPINERVKYVISCQGEKKYDDEYYQLKLVELFGHDVMWGEELKSGLSNNRNNALQLVFNHYSEPDSYVYICDDDISPNLEGLFLAIEAMKVDKLTCLTGIIKTKNGDFKNYCHYPYQHTKLSAAKVCSVEILINIDLIKYSNIFFDPIFGLGTNYPSGEEFIFLTDIISKGGKVGYRPINLCTHPPVSSGDDFYSNNDKIIAKGAMFKRVFSFPLYYIMIIAFAIKKHKEYKKNISFFGFLKQILIGTIGNKS
ncbi:hypothetical protein AB7W34_19670 [Providencia rettgeri]